ncbi:uncharacterized protein J8A68_003684 [[Candida] subhashii]|uniref:Uncharacterized protein n=1 Tax=[Candida] subhashii TaxID=561895 RepID=A0A8J5QIY6_9ASCO|nr:uncharacterized protein J8A68_003684 [[Candida] subhashii]KAG7662829.1 hypothetical protein J8A68_003684 [[Candida] subhashii]
MHELGQILIDTDEEDDFLPASAFNNARKFYKQQQVSESQAPSQGNNMPILPKNVIKAKRALVEYSKSSDQAVIDALLKRRRKPEF